MRLPTVRNENLEIGNSTPGKWFPEVLPILYCSKIFPSVAAFTPFSDKTF